MVENHNKHFLFPALGKAGRSKAVRERLFALIMANEGERCSKRINLLFIQLRV